MPLHQPLIVMELCVVNDSGSSRWVQERLPFVATYSLETEFTWISVQHSSLKSLSLPSSVVIITYIARFHIKQVRTRPQYATLMAHLHHLMSRDVRFANILQETKFFKHALRILVTDICRDIVTKEIYSRSLTVSTLGLQLIMLVAPLFFRLSAHLTEKIVCVNNMTASSATMRILENTVTIIKTTNLRWSSCIVSQ